MDYLPERWSLTVRFLRPFWRRRFKILRPFFVLFRARKPCLLARLRRLGWYVRFIILSGVDSSSTGLPIRVGPEQVFELAPKFVWKREC